MISLSLEMLETVHTHTYSIKQKEKKEKNLIMLINGRPLFSNNPEWMVIK